MLVEVHAEKGGESRADHPMEAFGADAQNADAGEIGGKHQPVLRDAALSPAFLLVGRQERRKEVKRSAARVGDGLFDGLGIGLGFTLALTLLGCVRELLGAGSLFGLVLLPEETNILLFILPPGAFITLGYLIALVNRLGKKS